MRASASVWLPFAYLERVTCVTDEWRGSMLLELLVTLEEVLLNLCGSIGTTVTLQPFCREQLQQWFVAQNKLFERCLVRGGGGGKSCGYGLKS